MPLSYGTSESPESTSFLKKLCKIVSDQRLVYHHGSLLNGVNANIWFSHLGIQSTLAGIKALLVGISSSQVVSRNGTGT